MRLMAYLKQFLLTPAELELAPETEPPSVWEDPTPKPSDLFLSPVAERLRQYP